MTNSKFLPFALPDITDDECSEVTAALQSNWITTGPRTKQFEADFAYRVNARHAVAVNSCTAALHLALEALGIGPGDEIIVPTLTFAATAEVVRYLDARPVMVDVTASDHNIDPACVDRAIGARTKAIIPVHYGGQTCRIDSILELAHARGIQVVEDAAHAFPAEACGRPVGCIGDITCFSFYATKTITTAEGGMATTENDEWADRMRIMSLHGISKDAWKRYSAEGSWYYEIVAPGFKYNMTDLAAALGNVQLRRADHMLERRRSIARAYREAFLQVDGLELLDVRDFDEHSWHLFVIKIVESAWNIERNELIEALKAQGIGTSVHFIPLHIHPYYRDSYGYRPDDFPVALDCFRRSVSLPIYSKMTESDVGRVVETVVSLARQHKR